MFSKSFLFFQKVSIIIFSFVAFANNSQALEPVYKDASSTNLPNVTAQSKDAHPIDIDGDGDLDIVIAHEYKANLLFVNDGTGNFTNESEERLPQIDRDSEDIFVADFDNDGDMDILFVSEDDEINEYYLNDGKGYFSTTEDKLPTTGITNGIAGADLNKDGVIDLVFGDGGQNKLLIGDGTGGFRDETKLRLPSIEDITQDLEFGDIDGDGDLDLLVANEDENRLLINNGEGIFHDESSMRLPYRSTGEETREVDLADVNGDGYLDIYFSNVNFRRTGSSQNRLLINDGTGFFSDETEKRLPGILEYTMDATFVDIDADGDMDIVTAGLVISGGLAAVPYRVFENDGDGHFSDATSSFFPDTAFAVGTDIEAADFNGDGKLDFFLTNRSGPDFLLIHQ